VATVDPRTLGLFRIALALLLLADLLKRCASIETWYFERGLLTLDGQLAQAQRWGFWSVLWWMRSDAAVSAAFAGFGLVYLGLLVGYRTKLFQVLALVSVVSLHARVNWLCNGGDFVLCSLCWWTMFLPLGRRFSLDARRLDAATRNEPVVSFAAFVALAQLAIIYFFNAANKTGATWRDGTAVHYLLQQERVITAAGLWAREHLPFAITRVLSFIVRWFEFSLPFLILSPWHKALCRRLAIGAIWLLHGGIALFGNFGIFSAVMCTFAMLLWTADDWAAVEPWLRGRTPARWTGGADATRTAAAARPSTKGRASDRLHRGLRIAGTAAIVFPLALAIPQVFVENRVIPAALRFHSPPRWFNRLVWITRLRQGWSMFAPNSTTTEMTVLVDAQTEDGRSVDPVYEAAVGQPEPRLDRIPVVAGMDVYWVDYLSHVPENADLRQDLRRWLGEYHLRTGHPGDKLKRFTVYLATQASPRPGGTEPTDVKRTALFSSSRGR
jgi:hypothetical protein